MDFSLVLRLLFLFTTISPSLCQFYPSKCSSTCQGPFQANELSFCGALVENYTTCLQDNYTAQEVDANAQSTYAIGQSAILQVLSGSTANTCLLNYKYLLCSVYFPQCVPSSLTVLTPCLQLCTNYFSACHSLQGPTCNGLQDTECTHVSSIATSLRMSLEHIILIVVFIVFIINAITTVPTQNDFRNSPL